VKAEADSNDITEHPHDDKSRPYLCTVCDKRYRTKDMLSRHRNIHTGKYKCTECGKCFHGNADLTVHNRIHSGEKPYKCSLCNKCFRQSSTLYYHTYTSNVHSNRKT